MAKNRTGGGFINRLINKLPVELHIPGGYQYCGPGTKLQKRLARGDSGINPLDVACKQHDIAYSKSNNIADRHKADSLLADRAWERVRAGDSSFGEKSAAWFVTNVMKAKRKLGMGVVKSISRPRGGTTKRKKKKKKTAFGSIVKDVNRHLKQKLRRGDDLKSASKIALSAARGAVRKAGGKRNVRLPRVIPLPSKSGGFLPLIPAILGGLSALGALTGGAAGVAKAVGDARASGRQLTELQRHNQTMEAIAMGKKGSGLFLKPHRKGLGLFLNTRPSKNYR